jgi:ParB-like chromosome segregation protein Spo0J
MPELEKSLGKLAEREVRIADITVPEKRMRQKMLDPASLAESMRDIGLLHPIAITEENVLVAGLHRLRAAGLLGWERIDARVVGGGELEAKLAEIDENLLNHHLTGAEEAKHIARREEIMQARGGRAKGGGDRRGYAKSDPATVAGALEKTTADLAKEAGMSERTYRTRAKIGRDLTEETLDIISELDPNDSDLPNSTRQLNYLAGVDDPDDQAEIARRVATGEAVSVWAASTQLKEERGEITQGQLHQAAMGAAMKEEVDRKGDEDPVSVEGIRKAGKMEYVVEWSDGTASTVNRQSLLIDHAHKKCKHCAGYGVIKKAGK